MLERKVRHIRIEKCKELLQFRLFPGKFWHWKLSPTEQYLLYEDCEERQPPKLEDMKSKGKGYALS